MPYSRGLVLAVLGSWACSPEPVLTAPPIVAVQTVHEDEKGDIVDKGAAPRNPFAITPYWSETDIADTRELFPEHCSLHDEAMQPDTVEMFCGTLLFGHLNDRGLVFTEYFDAERVLFPNANYYAGFDYENSAATVRFCSSCRATGARWIDQHRTG